MVEFVLWYLTVGFAASMGFGSGLMMTYKAPVNPYATAFSLMLTWPLLVFSYMKYLAFYAWKDDDDQGD